MPRLTGQTPNNDIYRLDDGEYDSVPVSVQIIGLWDGMPPTLLAAARARRAATVTGTCPLCALDDRFHQSTCPAAFGNMSAALAHWERFTRPHERGRRLVEDPTNVVAAVVYERLDL